MNAKSAMTTGMVVVAAMALVSGIGAAGCAVDATGTSREAPLPAPPSEGGLQLGLHAPAGLTEEARLCRLVILPDGAGLEVAAFEHELAEGAAEVRLSHTTLSIADAWEHPSRVGCEELDAFAGEAFYSSTEPSGLAELPAGAAVRLAPLEVVLVEARFAPAATVDVAPAVAVNLWLAAAE